MLLGEILQFPLADFLQQPCQLSYQSMQNFHLATTISNGLLGLFENGYMLYNYDETSVAHTKHIDTLLGLNFNCLKPFLDELLVTLGDSIQASRARRHLNEK